jgi:hypothetical protein
MLQETGNFLEKPWICGLTLPRAQDSVEMAALLKLESALIQMDVQMMIWTELRQFLAILIPVRIFKLLTFLFSLPYSMICDC